MIGRLCLVHPDHLERVPIITHHIRPASRGGRTSRTVRLCANAHGLVHDLLDVIEDAAADSPYGVVAEIVRHLPPERWAQYPGAVRVVAYAGWKTYGLGFMQGTYAREYALWDSAGRPRTEGIPTYADVRQAARWSRRWRRELGAGHAR